MTGEYAFIKRQIPYKTGVFGIECPNCHQGATARVRKLQKGNSANNYGSFRPVGTICRHCGVTYTFQWK